MPNIHREYQFASFLPHFWATEEHGFNQQTLVPAYEADLVTTWEHVFSIDIGLFLPRTERTIEP